MYAFVIDQPGFVRRRVCSNEDDVTIGSAETDDIRVVGERIAPTHARVRRAQGRYTLEAVRSASINGARVISPALLHHDDRIAVGDVTLTLDVAPVYSAEFPDDDFFSEEITEERLFAAAAPAAREAELLAAIAAGQDDARMVYADWLEERGETVRAEFLRVDTGDPANAARLRELSPQLDVAWRARVARVPLENCNSAGAEPPLAFAFECPRTWSALAPTDRTEVRFCNACERHVYYCATISDAQHRAHYQGECVAVDTALVRRPGDLIVKMRTMGMLRR